MCRLRLIGANLFGFAFLLAMFSLPSIGQEVTLPLERYEKLRDQARPEPLPPLPTPIAFERASLTVTVNENDVGGRARIVQDLTVTLMDDGWQSLALGNAGSVIDADFGPTEGRLDADSSGGTTVVLRGVGQHRLRITSVVSLERDEAATRPTWRLEWTVPRAAVVDGVVETEGATQEIEAKGAIVAGVDTGRWTFVATPGGTMILDLLGVAVVPERRGLPLAFEATSGLAIEVSRSRRRATGWLEIQVRQGELEHLTVPIPEGFEVIDVGGRSIAGWDVEDDLLSVTPLMAVVDSLSLEVELAADTQQEFVGAVLRPNQVASMVAATKVHVSGDGLLELVDAGSARRPDGREQAELPAAFVQAPGMALVGPSAGAPSRWMVSWAEATEVLAAQVDRLRVDVLIGDSGSAGYQLWAEVRNRGDQQLTFEWPAGVELIDARRDDRRLEPGLVTDAASGNVPGAWTVPLAAGDESQIVFISCLMPLALPVAGHLELPLPSLSAPIGRLEVSVSLPGGSRYELADRSRASAIGSPPEARLAAGHGQLFGLVDAAPTAGLAESPPRLFSRPPGFPRITAAWSALSASPAPLRIRILDDRDERRWF